MKKKKASGVGKLGSHGNLYDRTNPTKGSTLYNSMNQINKVPNLGPQFRIISNGQGNQNDKATWTAAGSCFPLPESKGFNFPSNNWISKPCDDDNHQYLGEEFNHAYYPPLQTNCNFNSTSQNFVGYYAIEDHNYDGSGTYIYMCVLNSSILYDILNLIKCVNNVFQDNVIKCNLLLQIPWRVH